MNTLNENSKIMRDTFITEIYHRMSKNDKIFFLSADMGAPTLDKLRADYSDRFINVGIAEQNLIEVACGLALEGFDVIAYAIAPFVTMRSFEQLRINLALLTQTRPVNVNFIGVGTGFSYDVSGPTHHCVEDISLVRTLPNIHLFCPSDWVLVHHFVDYALEVKAPKYLRLDGKPQPAIYDVEEKIDFPRGFRELVEGDEACLVTTGYCTQKALRLGEQLAGEGISIGVVDAFLLRPFDFDALATVLGRYKHILTMEESFVGKGALDSLVGSVILDNNLKCTFKRFGVPDTYIFDKGSREELHCCCGMGEDDVKGYITHLLR